MNPTSKRGSWPWWLLAYLALALVVYLAYQAVLDGRLSWFARGSANTSKRTSVTTVRATVAIKVSPTPVTDPEEAEHIRRVAVLAREFQDANQAAPRDLEQLRKWAVPVGRATAEDFVSTRDGQPYDLVTDAAGTVVMEHTGRNGKKYVHGLRVPGEGAPGKKELTNTAAGR